MTDETKERFDYIESILKAAECHDIKLPRQIKESAIESLEYLKQELIKKVNELDSLRTEIEFLSDETSDNEDRIQDLEFQIKQLEAKQIEGFEHETLHGEMSNDIVRNLFNNCSLEQLEAIEAEQKKLIKNYIDFNH